MEAILNDLDNNACVLSMEEKKKRIVLPLNTLNINIKLNPLNLLSIDFPLMFSSIVCINFSVSFMC